MTNIFAVTPTFKASTIFDDDWETVSVEDPLTEPTILNFDVDLLAAYLKMQAETTKAFGEAFIDMSAFGSQITNRVVVDAGKEYIEQADKIRNYYKAKIVQLSLRGREISAYRSKLYQVISNPTSIDVKHIGILCRLPDFYKEDVAIDQILEQAVSANEHNFSWIDTVTDCYTFIDSTVRKAKRNSQTNFWFKNSKNELALLSVDYHSSAIPFLKMILKPGKQFEIKLTPYLAPLRGRIEDCHVIKIASNYEIKECA